ncbi:MAG: hypothetical protein BGP06_03255 [Rhizobiales bacterium 65-9]|nr:hypothetical protein [Hyphomicrobiales bacterium]OJY35872.1 MAG: hypothetical protein BGP06_03255 [Rhizobiales bacterium 65-9]
MSRVAFEVVIFFVVPFILFAGWLVARGRPVMSKESWEGAGGWLTIAGLAIVVAAFIYVGATADRGSGTYEPAHLEDGRLAPGRLK